MKEETPNQVNNYKSVGRIHHSVSTALSKSENTTERGKGDAWYLYQMVVYFMLRTYDINQVFFRFDDSFVVTKCLQQIEMPDLLHVGAQ